VLLPWTPIRQSPLVKLLNLVESEAHVEGAKVNESRRSRRSWGPWAFGALALLAASCFYTFDNPVEKEPPGSVAGTIALQGAVGNQTAAGGRVTVQWTNGLELSLNSSSKFLFQDLPDGTYSLEVNIPPLAKNDYPLVLLRPDVVLPNAGVSTDSLDIGTLEVPASGIVGGTVSPADAGIVVGAFVPAQSANQIGVFEGFSTTTDSSGHYSLQLPAGNHALAASNPLDNAVGQATIVSGASQTVNLTLSPIGQVGQISGSLVGSGYGASANGNVPWDGATYVALGAGGALVGDGGLFPGGSDTSGGPGGTGSAFQVLVLGGQLVSLTLLPVPTNDAGLCAAFAPFMLPAVPVIAGFTTTLGQVTWLDNAALGANGIGPCADGGSSPVEDGGIDGGPVLMGWIDAGTLPWDGGEIAQMVVLPLTPDAGGTAVAWIAGQVGQYNLYAQTLLDGVASQVWRLTIGGQVSNGSLSGTQLAGGVIVTFSNNAGQNATTCEVIPSNGTAPQGFVTSFLPNDPALALEQTTTFTGQLNGVDGVFVFQVMLEDAGVAGVFSDGGQPFGQLIGLEPGGAGSSLMVSTLIGTSCDLADLHGEPGFCLAGSGDLAVDGGTTTVGFVSSFATNGDTPAFSGAVFTSPPNFDTAPVYVGLTALPGEVAVAMGPYSMGNVYYWEFTDLTIDAGAGTPIATDTDFLLNYDGSVVGLSQPQTQGGGTAFQFLPSGAQTAPLSGLVNGSDIPSAYVDPLNNDIVIAVVPNSGPDAYGGAISILRLVPDGG